MRDVATTRDLLPLTNGTYGDDIIYGDDGFDVAYGQGGNDSIQGNADDDRLEGNAGADTIEGDEGRDDIVGGTGRTFSNDERPRPTAGSTAATCRRRRHAPRRQRPGQRRPRRRRDHRRQRTVDRCSARPSRRRPSSTACRSTARGRGAAGTRRTSCASIRLLDVARTGFFAPEANGTNGADTINGEAE